MHGGDGGGGGGRLLDFDTDRGRALDNDFANLSTPVGGELTPPPLLTVPGYRWSGGLGLCDTSSDTHTAHLYPGPWQCEQAETQTNGPNHCAQNSLHAHEDAGTGNQTSPGTRYRPKPGQMGSRPKDTNPHECRFPKCLWKDNATYYRNHLEADDSGDVKFSD